jgi:hypothetical protein
VITVDMADETENICETGIELFDRRGLDPKCMRVSTSIESKFCVSQGKLSLANAVHSVDSASIRGSTARFAAQDALDMVYLSVSASKMDCDEIERRIVDGWRWWDRLSCNGRVKIGGYDHR